MISAWSRSGGIASDVDASRVVIAASRPVGGEVIEQVFVS
jgi:hypothetical protein